MLFYNCPSVSENLTLKLNIDHNFCIVSDGACIFHMWFIGTKVKVIFEGKDQISMPQFS